MVTLVVVGFLAGIITSISPCVLPVLPVVLTAGTARREPATVGAGRPSARPDTRSDTRTDTQAGGWTWRPYGVVAGLVVSFSLATLFGSLVLSALRLPQDLLRDLGIVVLVVIGLGLVIEPFGELLSRPFARLPARRVNPDGNGFVLGLGLGLLYVPCAGPVLATIAVVGASHTIGLGALVLTAAFGVGAGVPLLVLAVAGEQVARRTGALRQHARRLRVVGGVLMIVVAALIGLNLTDGLQRNVPGYTTALQHLVASNRGATDSLHALSHGSATGPGGNASASTPRSGAQCTADGQVLQNCGTAPELTGLTGWLNTPGGRPLSLAGLRGKVVLIDFWTYSCINCQRTLPHTEAWYREYAKDGFVIIGVHTPEFAFEHVPSNVAAQAKTLGVRYPVAIDDDYATWNAYNNQYWPAEYLVDPHGQVRHITFGEGGYGTTEELIRELLTQANPDVSLPRATDVPDRTPTEVQTPETYLGYQYAPLHLSGTPPVRDAANTSSFPATVAKDTFALAGTWTSDPEDLVAGPDARLRLNYQARTVYLVLGGTGTVDVAVNGRHTKTVAVSGVPKLYTLVSGQGGRARLTLTASPGVQAYDFTFG